MKREIRFRAWDDNRNKYASGYIIYPAGTTEYPEGGWDLHGADDGLILEQFTGLRDSKGVEVYEGDVVSDGADKGHIFWRVDLARFACTNSVMFDDRVEVIGTIHDAEYKELAK